MAGRLPVLLSFREAPVLVEAFRRLRKVPDAVMIDGQGVAHPRGLGLASHIGLWLGVPTVGCAKSRLVGEHRPPVLKKCNYSFLRFRGRRVGAAVVTRAGVKPVFVSPGHMMDISASIGLVKACCTRYRIPETTRLPHLEVTKWRKSVESR